MKKLLFSWCALLFCSCGDNVSEALDDLFDSRPTAQEMCVSLGNNWVNNQCKTNAELAQETCISKGNLWTNNQCKTPEITERLITPGKTIKDSITENSSHTTYQLILLKAGKLSINITTDGTSSALPNYGAEIQILNGNNVKIKGTNGGFILPHNEIMDLYAGVYYIEIIGRYGAGNTGIYSIRVDYFNEAVADNNTFSTAQLLVPGLTVSSNITLQDSIDLYKYVLTTAGRLTVNVSNGSGLSYVYVRWYNANGNRIKNETSYYNSAYGEYMDLEAGTYYIGIEKYSSSYTGTYNMRGDFTAAENNEFEANETRATAQLLTYGQNVKGFISYQDSTDMYRYILTETGRLTVNVSNGSGLSYVYVRWYDVNGNRIKNETSYYNSAYRGYMDLEAGTYYIGIEKYSSSYTGTYNLTIQ